MKRTVLGNPFVRLWDELRAIAGGFDMREFFQGCYYIRRGRKGLA